MLKASGICKRYSRHTVLRNATLCLEGEIKALIGINGSGKSTFLKVIAGIVQADSGEVFINGENVTKLYPEHRNVGYVPQYPALFQHLNVEENILYGIRKNKRASKAVYERVIEMLGLGDILKKRPRELSGGYKSRVSLARALVPQPHVLLMDEPLVGMDIVVRKHILPDFRKVLKEFQIPVLYVTHDLEEAELMADSFAVMNGGEIKPVASAPEAFNVVRNSFLETM